MLIATKNQAADCCRIDSLKVSNSCRSSLLNNLSSRVKPLLIRSTDKARRISGKPIPLLIHGESGVGKALFARAVHDSGSRREGCLGRLRGAHGGTLFLDEIGDMPLPMQTRLLRVLQERQVTPLGGGRAVEVDIALICATHCKLREAADKGNFRCGADTPPMG